MVGQPERQRAGRYGAFNKSCSEVLGKVQTQLTSQLLGVSSITSLKTVGQLERQRAGRSGTFNTSCSEVLRKVQTRLTSQLLGVSSSTSLKMVGQPERQKEGRSGAFNKSCSELLATNGHKPIKGESDGEPDRAVSGCIKQDSVDITHGEGVQEIKLFPINNGNVSEDQVEDNDQEIRRCHGPQELIPIILIMMVLLVLWDNRLKEAPY
ncbi:uncharacterized protein [Chiloscyllium punctatum]|uniref:uncharacterized protein n=1 Tax=Chiloscyllium punctatum TaxID=137246 RepID=UPI003B64192C